MRAWRKRWLEWFPGEPGGPDARPPAAPVSVAITTYRSESFIAEALQGLKGDARCDEVVILDDGSPEESFARMQVAAETAMGQVVRVRRQPENVGAFRNKVGVLAECRNEWAVLLDADNTLPRAYLDRLFRLKVWVPDVIYCPERAEPAFDFARYAGRVLDARATGRLLADERNRDLRVLLNTGNFFVHVPTLRRRLAAHAHVPIRSACSITLNYLWLVQGGRLYVVPGLAYGHRVHGGSNFMRHEKKARSLHRLLRESLIAGTPADLFAWVEAQAAAEAAGGPPA